MSLQEGYPAEPAATLLTLRPNPPPLPLLPFILLIFLLSLLLFLLFLLSASLSGRLDGVLQPDGAVKRQRPKRLLGGGFLIVIEQLGGEREEAMKHGG